MHGSQDSMSSMLPPHAIHNRSSQNSESIDTSRRGNEGDASAMVKLRKHLFADVDEDRSTAPLTVYCFMTGLIDSVTFSAIFVWCAFQTGNSIQLALALARLFSGQHDYSFHIADRQALCSLLAFLFGAFIGRIGDKLGCKTRLWLSFGTFIQTLFTMAAAVVIWKSDELSITDARADPAWTNALSFVCIGFLSASMGLQAIMGKRVNTHFATTVVLTTTWCELMADPRLFDIRRIVISRNHKIVAIGSLFLGGFIGRVLIDSIGSAATLGIGTGIRLIISIWWLFIPEKQAMN
ncbi:uncharacterized protein EDB93DRAFT_113355 [Suillus bovinus]|uniref:uncharacterized protein n=1 Tax=Suillus bovinus TaxID=48563 RepID=UPI001B874082|nr:uncharacterized protein EDB93DRAFT_113355 [Suillus bovinus]KAG2129651.1 hypothetical protein EDB93DRAFT_113355 [Suillus bovinus]